MNWLYPDSVEHIKYSVIVTEYSIKHIQYYELAVPRFS